MSALKRIGLSALGVCMSVFVAGNALAEGNLTIVATPDQFADMKPLLGDLADESVEVKQVAPADLAKAQGDKYVLVVYSQDAPNAVADKFSDAQKQSIAADGGKKLILLRNPWTDGQEVIVFAGNKAADSAALRKETKSTWWGMVGSWFDINTDGMHGY